MRYIPSVEYQLSIIDRLLLSVGNKLVIFVDIEFIMPPAENFEFYLYEVLHISFYEIPNILARPEIHQKQKVANEKWSKEIPRPYSRQ